MRSFSSDFVYTVYISKWKSTGEVWDEEKLSIGKGLQTKLQLPSSACAHKDFPPLVTLHGQ